MGKEIHCPECGYGIAEWIEKQKQFKVRYSKDDKKVLKKHTFILPVQTYCNNCHRGITIQKPIYEKLFCSCRVGTDSFVADAAKPRTTGEKVVQIRLAAILASVDCADTMVRCKNCQHDMRLTTVMDGGGTFGRRDDRETDFDDFLWDNNQVGGSKKGFPKDHQAYLDGKI